VKLAGNHIILLIIPVLFFIVQPEVFAAKGDKIDIQNSWKINADEEFNIILIDNKYATEERIESIKETILSDESIVLADILMGKDSDESSTYYLGWFGALNAIKNTKYLVPQKLSFDVTKSKTANIIIELSNMGHPEKFAGYAVPLVQNGYMIQSTITIYNIDALTIEQLQTILRHELGHGFGVEHSTDSMDLMHPEIITFFPFISPCVIHGIESLYNGESNTEFTCEN
jgi:hypothetical protein